MGVVPTSIPQTMVSSIAVGSIGVIIFYIASQLHTTEESKIHFGNNTAQNVAITLETMMQISAYFVSFILVMSSLATGLFGFTLLLDSKSHKSSNYEEKNPKPLSTEKHTIETKLKRI